MATRNPGVWNTVVVLLGLFGAFVSKNKLDCFCCSFGGVSTTLFICIQMIRLWFDFLRTNLPLENFDSKHLKMSNLGNTTLILLVFFLGEAGI